MKEAFFDNSFSRKGWKDLHNHKLLTYKIKHAQPEEKINN